MATTQVDFLDIYPFNSIERTYLCKLYEQGSLLYIGITEWNLDNADVNRYTLQLNHLLDLAPMYDRSVEMEELMLDLDDVELASTDVLDSCFWFYWLDENKVTNFSCFYRTC